MPMAYRSCWSRSSGTTGYPALAGRVSADVVVVGGGLTGLWTAWELARSGLRTVVLESGRIASSATAQTSGTASVLGGPVYGDLAVRRGRDVARLAAQAQTDAVEHFAAALDELPVDCGFERRAAYLYAGAGHSLSLIRTEATAAAEAGLPAVLTANPGLPFPVEGAIRLDGQVQFHPRTLALALAADLLRRGSAVYETSRVTGLDDGEPCVAVTEHGAAVVARHMVVATGYPVAAPAGIRQALSTRRRIGVAGVVPEADAPEGIYLSREAGTRSIRSAPYDDGRRLVVVGGEVFEPGSGKVRARYAALTHWAAEKLGLHRIDDRWSVQETATADGLPLIGRVSSAPEHQHTWIAAGLGGFSMTSSVVAARVLAAAISGAEPPPWSPIFEPGRPTATSSHDGARRRSGAAVAVRHRVDAAEKAAVANVGRGEAAVLDIGGEHCAVYRDDSGLLHALSAVCSHMGCVVGFNDAERTWECPCHGSRFGVDGQVLQGPAVRALSPALALMEVSAR